MPIPGSFALNCDCTELCLRPGGNSMDVLSRTHGFVSSAAEVIAASTISGGKNLAQAMDKGISVPFENTWGLLCESKEFNIMALVRKRAKFSDKP